MEVLLDEVESVQFLNFMRLTVMLLEVDASFSKFSTGENDEELFIEATKRKSVSVKVTAEEKCIFCNGYVMSGESWF
jgi:hypothetical protein